MPRAKAGVGPSAGRLSTRHERRGSEHVTRRKCLRRAPARPRGLDYRIGQAPCLPSRSISQSMPAVSGCSNLFARRSSRACRSGPVLAALARWFAPAIASSRTWRERDRPGARCGAADRSARLSSGSSVTWMRRWRVGTERVYHRCITIDTACVSCRWIARRRGLRQARRAPPPRQRPRRSAPARRRVHRGELMRGGSALGKEVRCARRRPLRRMRRHRSARAASVALTQEPLRVSVRAPPSS